MEKDFEPGRMRSRAAYFLIKRFHSLPEKVLCDWTGVPFVHVT